MKLMISQNNKLAICKKTRKIAAKSLYNTLEKVLTSKKKISEAQFRDLWHLELRKNKTIFPDGWYIPPPHGIGVLFGSEKNTKRLSYKSLRPKEMSPNNDNFLDTQNGIAYLYASPIHRKTGIIGDFGITIYLGINKELKEYLKTCLDLDRKIFRYAQLKMRLSEVTKFAEKIFLKYGLSNEIESINDPTGVNIGHTIPMPSEEWAPDEKKIVKRDGERLRNLISKKRLFVNSIEKTYIKPGMAFTIEPRPSIIDKPHLPKSLSYHTIAIFKENGKKELLTNFDEIFKLVGMDYMLSKL